VNVSEMRMRDLREFLARDVIKETEHLIKDDPFSRGLTAGMDIANRSALSLFDAFFPELRPQASNDVT
jgi:hypothetical protein